MNARQGWRERREKVGGDGGAWPGRGGKDEDRDGATGDQAPSPAAAEPEAARGALSSGSFHAQSQKSAPPSDQTPRKSSGTVRSRPAPLTKAG
eukprot:607107-Pyramimonas_sp.AAC.1